MWIRSFLSSESSKSICDLSAVVDDIEIAGLSLASCGLSFLSSGLDVGVVLVDLDLLLSLGLGDARLPFLS